MSQPPNPPSGGSPQQPGGWTPPGDPGNWQSDPTQQLPTSPQYPTSQYPTSQYPTSQYPTSQYPPTQPLPAQGPGYTPGPYGASGQDGPGQYGPPGGAFGAPPSGGFGGPPGGNYPPSSGNYPPSGGNYPPSGGGYGAPPPPSGGGRRSVLPVVIGVVAGVVVLGLAAWFLFLRPSGTASPSPSTQVSSPAQPSVSASPSVLITPSAPPSEPSTSTSPSARPSGTTSAACGPDLSNTQCEWAVYLRAFVQVDSCRLDDSDRQRDAFVCAANARGKLKGTATVSMRWANDAKDLTGLMDNFFARAGVAKSKLGKNWKNPPALTNWWYTDTPKQINGKLGSADAKDGSGRVAWTFSKQRFFIEAVSKGDDADAVLAWWART